MSDIDKLLLKLNKFDTDNQFFPPEPLPTITLDIYEVHKILKWHAGFNRWQTVLAAIDLVKASGDL